MIAFDRQRLIFGLYALALVAITQLVTSHFKWASWPAFVAWILFFVEQMNFKKAPYILIGAVSGMGLLVLAPVVTGLLTPQIGVDWAALVYILLSVYAIVAFGEMVPHVLNNYAFLYLTIGAVALQGPNPHPLAWAVIAAVGGGLLIAGTKLIGKLMGVSAATTTTA